VILRLRRASQLVESPGIGEQLPGQPPRLLGRVLQAAGCLAFEKINVRQEVVRAPSALQARDELQQYAVDAVAQARFVPLHFKRVFLALVQQ